LLISHLKQKTATFAAALIPPWRDHFSAAKIILF
jgi:hypothetical protein